MSRVTRKSVRSLCLLLLLLAAPAFAQAPMPAAATPPLRVLFVGNSLTYTNHLPRLVGAVAASQPGGPGIDTATYVIPGAELDELWDAGHAAQALRAGHWDVVVLQERGGMAGCLAPGSRDPQCRRSDAAYRRFIALAGQADARVLLLMGWPGQRGNDLGNASRLRSRAERLEEAFAGAARRWSRSGVAVEVVPAAAALYRFAQGRAPTDVLVDGVHPSVQASLLMAAQLYAAITGRSPRPADLAIDFPLLPPNARVLPDSPIETQPQIAGDGSRVLLKAGAVAPLYAAAAD